MHHVPSECGVQWRTTVCRFLDISNSVIGCTYKRYSASIISAGVCVKTIQLGQSHFITHSFIHDNDCGETGPASVRRRVFQDFRHGKLRQHMLLQLHTTVSFLHIQVSD